MWFYGVLFATIFIGWRIYRSYYNSHDHVRGNPACYKENARVMDVRLEIVGRSPCLYRTTVTYSDSFKFISHDTFVTGNVGFGSYTISLPPDLRRFILAKARERHLQEIGKRNYKRNKKLGIDVSDSYTIKPEAIPQEKTTPVEAPSWVCSNCETRNMGSSDKCWNCGTTRNFENT